ncbi:DUF2283 domain-containing protein [Bacillaceae bacterium IKA-2]|nr:DUF2283 domain-containing protein [Bacillaceae bacterium IKA-2]
MSNNFIEQMTYDNEAEMAYIYLTEPNKFAVFTEELPENPEIILDLGKEVPIVGVELGGESAKKIQSLNSKDKKFTKKTAENGDEYFSFRFENKPVCKSIPYERIVDIHFLFADADCLDLIGIDIFNKNPEYLEYLSDK